MRTRSFVITASQSWDTFPVTDINYLAREMSERSMVLYVNPPSDMISLMRGGGKREFDRRRRVLRGCEPVLRHINHNLWVLEPPVLLSQPSRVHSDAVFDILNKQNNKVLAEVIKWATEFIALSEYTLIVDNEVVSSQYLNEFLDPEYLVYYRRRSLTGSLFWHRYGDRLERTLIAKSDVVVTSSHVLAEQVEEANYNTFDIGRGTVIDGFDFNRRYDLPAELVNLPHPVIGCVSTVLGSRTVSANLLYRLAKAYEECSLVLVGGEDAYFASHKLHTLPNVHFVGGRSDAELPAYIAGFDMCVCAQPDNETTRVNYPDSLVRYLAMGKPVVANYCDSLRPFASKILIGADDVEFIGLVGIGFYEAFSMTDASQRATYAGRYVWANCVERLFSILDMVRYEVDEVEQVFGEPVPIYS